MKIQALEITQDYTQEETRVTFMIDEEKEIVLGSSGDSFRVLDAMHNELDLDVSDEFMNFFFSIMDSYCGEDQTL